MNRLEKLKQERREIIERQKKELQNHDDKIAKEKERIKKDNEKEKKKKEQPTQQNSPTEAGDAYKEFVKDSKLSIAGLNEMLEKFLNEE